ncbi:MAG: NAD-dependent epimerase/dehydratase family protein [Crocinitomicaceae bacterium]|nr:MAG: NAD-dependent epimerase/dehydratase family protein [Crocinitomicaceae bacterium]
MERETKNILVTGGAGFIGSNLCHYLTKQNFNVLCLDNFDDFYSEEIKLNNIKSLLNEKSFKLIRGDVRDSKLLKTIFKNNKIETVIHLAAKAGVRNSILNPSEYFDINVNGTLTLLEAMSSNGVKNLVFASSSSVYGNQNGKLKETEKCNEQISPYAVSKKTAELLNYSYHVNFNMNVINLRLFSVYGKNQRPDLVIHKFFNQISQNKPIELYGNGETKRDYTYIDDVVQAFYNSVLYLENPKQNVYEIINIGNDKPISLNELLDCIKEVTQNDRIEVLNREIAKGDVETTHADIKKAKTLLNYNPSVSLNEGIKLFYDWFKNEKI